MRWTCCGQLQRSMRMWAMQTCSSWPLLSLSMYAPSPPPPPPPPPGQARGANPSLSFALLSSYSYSYIQLSETAAVALDLDDSCASQFMSCLLSSPPPPPPSSPPPLLTMSTLAKPVFVTFACQCTRPVHEVSRSSRCVLAAEHVWVHQDMLEGRCLEPLCCVRCPALQFVDSS